MAADDYLEISIDLLREIIHILNKYTMDDALDYDHGDVIELRNRLERMIHA